MKITGGSEVEQIGLQIRTKTQHTSITKPHPERSNTICTLLNDKGEHTTSEEDIFYIAFDYFRNLYTSEKPDISSLTNLQFNVLSPTRKENLLRPYTEEELLKALKQLPGRKSLDPDGLHTIFIKKHWDTLGSDITKTVLGCLNNGDSFEALNNTHIALVPKCKSPVLISEFWPISLSTSVYKLLSRMIVNRMKGVIDT